MSSGRNGDKYSLELRSLKGQINELKPPKDEAKAAALSNLKKLISDDGFGEYDSAKQSRVYTSDQLRKLFDAVEELWKLSNQKLLQDKKMLGGILKVSRSKSKTSDAAEDIITNLVGILQGAGFEYQGKIETKDGRLDAKATIVRMRNDLARPIKANTSEAIKQSLEAMRRENEDSMMPRASRHGLFSGAAAAAPDPKSSQPSTPKPGRKS